jgi:hypothetical protein
MANVNSITPAQKLVKKLALGFYNSTTPSVRSETYKSKVTDNPFDFDVQLGSLMRRGELYEIYVQNIVTNWLPQSNIILPSTINIPVKILCVPAIVSTQGASYRVPPQNNHIYPTPGTYDVTKTYLVFCRNPGFDIPVAQWNNDMFSTSVRIPAGLNLENQNIALQLIGIQLQAFMNGPNGLSGAKCTEYFGTTKGLNINWAASAGDPADNFWWNPCQTSQTSFQFSLGTVQGSQGKLGWKLAGFQPCYCLAIKYINDGVSNNLTSCMWVGAYYCAFIDCLSLNGFQYTQDVGQNDIHVQTSHDSVKIARLLGMPHDVVYPGEVLALDGTGYTTMNEMQVMMAAQTNANQIDGLGNSKPTVFSPIKVTQQQALFWDASYLVNFQVYGVWADWIDARLWNKVTTPFNPNAGLLSPKIRQINYNGSSKWSDTSNNQPMQQWLTQTDVIIPSILVRPFYNANAFNVDNIRIAQGCIFSLLYQPDYYMDNKSLTFLLSADEVDQYGGTLYDGQSTNVIQVAITTNANPYGAFSQEGSISDQNTIVLANSFPINNDPLDQKSQYTYNELDLVFQSQQVSFFSSPNFTPLVVTLGVGATQTTSLCFGIERVNTVGTLRLKILNELDEPPQDIQSFSGIIPYTQVTLQFKIFAPTSGALNTSQLARSVDVSPIQRVGTSLPLARWNRFYSNRNGVRKQRRR